MGKEEQSEVKQQATPAATPEQPAKKPKREPLEVWVHCPWTDHKLVAEYRGEVNRKGSTPRYKVYSPFFAAEDAKPADLAKAHRWVPRIKILGLAPSREEVEEFLATSAYEDLKKLGYAEGERVTA